MENYHYICITETLKTIRNMKGNYTFRVRTWGGYDVALPKGLDKYYGISLDYAKGIAKGIALGMLARGIVASVYVFNTDTERLSFIQQ